MLENQMTTTLLTRVSNFWINLACLVILKKKFILTPTGRFLFLILTTRIITRSTIFFLVPGERV